MERENITRAAKGDANAFEALMGTYEKKIYALCLRMMGNPHDGEDSAQEAMLRIWRTMGQYRFESAFSTWIYRVTASCCMDAIRRRQRQTQPSLEELGEAEGFDPADGGETPHERAERMETRSEIQQAISAVPETMREVFLLRDVHGLSVEETAQALQIAQGTVKSRLARAREKIAAELKRRGAGQTGGERHAV